MAGSVDVSARKPRRTRGTPSYSYRNKFALGVIVAGITTFTIFAITPLFRTVNKRLLDNVFVKSEEEDERKAIFINSFIKQRRGEDILRVMQHKEEIEKER